MQLVAEPDQQEDWGTVLVLVLVLVLLVLVHAQMQGQVKVEVQMQQMPVFPGIDLVRQHTAVLNVQANCYR